MKTLRFIIITLLMLTSATQFAGAAIRIFTNTADSGTGSLRDTIAVSSAGEELVLVRSLTIEGLGRRILIDGNGASRVFNNTARTDNTARLTITNGFHNGAGPLSEGGGPLAA